jgi:hypothetical protein
MMSRGPAYIRDANRDTRRDFFINSYSARLKNAIVSCSQRRGLSIVEAMEEAAVLWLQLNGHPVMKFDKLEMYKSSIKELKRRRKILRKLLKKYPDGDIPEYETKNEPWLSNKS